MRGDSLYGIVGFNTKHEDLLPLCKFNPRIACECQMCGTCGWNPAVEEKRKEKIRKKMSAVTTKIFWTIEWRGDESGNS